MRRRLARDLAGVREYERASTTAIDAYLGPSLGGDLEALSGAAPRKGCPEPLVMRSSGGVATIAEAVAHPSFALLSGPAAGVVGVVIAARAAGVEDAISLDMGGTSTDVALIRNGEVERGVERSVAGFPVRLPSVDIQTVGAGGGSIVWLDEGGALVSGPRARARTRARPATGVADRVRPRPTPTSSWAGSRIRSRAASASTARRLSARSATSTRKRWSRAVIAEMVRAVRLVSVERGHDPRGCRSSRSAGRGLFTPASLRTSFETALGSFRRARRPVRARARGE